MQFTSVSPATSAPRCYGARALGTFCAGLPMLLAIVLLALGGVAYLWNGALQTPRSDWVDGSAGRTLAGGAAMLVVGLALLTVVWKTGTVIALACVVGVGLVIRWSDPGWFDLSIWEHNPMRPAWAWAYWPMWACVAVFVIIVGWRLVQHARCVVGFPRWVKGLQAVIVLSVFASLVSPSFLSNVRLVRLLNSGFKVQPHAEADLRALKEDEVWEHARRAGGTILKTHQQLAGVDLRRFAAWTTNYWVTLEMPSESLSAEERLYLVVRDPLARAGWRFANMSCEDYSGLRVTWVKTLEDDRVADLTLLSKNDQFGPSRKSRSTRTAIGIEVLPKDPLIVGGRWPNTQPAPPNAQREYEAACLTNPVESGS